MTYSIFQSNKENFKLLNENKYHLKFFQKINLLNTANLFSQEDTFTIINFLFNLISNNEFFHLFQKQIGTEDKILPIQKLLEILTNNPESRSIQYISLINDDFLFIILKILFEWSNVPEEAKLCYTKIIRRMVKHSLFNSASCAQVLSINLIKISYYT